MFVGHYGIGIVAAAAIPEVPAIIPLTGVAFPDLLWSVLVMTGKEHIRVKEGSPLTADIEFYDYPYSHSLVLTSLIALAPALVLALMFSAKAAIVFLIASISHWLLDVLVHKGDMPVLGFGKDVKIGFGLWNYAWLSFILEYFTFILPALILPALGLLSFSQTAWILGFGTLLHAANANGFFGFNPKGVPPSTAGFAGFVLFGFVLATVVFTWFLR